MPYHLRKIIAYILPGTGKRSVPGIQVFGNFLLKGCFIKLAIFKSYRKGLKSFRGNLFNQGSGGTGIQASAQVSSNRHISPEPDPYSIRQDTFKFFCCISRNEPLKYSISSSGNFK